MKYRLCFEVVTPYSNGKFCKTSTDTVDPWQQYRQLKAWEKSGEQPIRGVHLYEITEKLTEIGDKK